MSATRHLYVHVPFCARRCSYCDFSIAVRREVPRRAFAEAIGQECTRRGIREQSGELTTVYLGGGTPSRLGADGVAALLDALREHVAWGGDGEVTLEANPEDVTPAAVRAWRVAGINRISLGTQSFDDRVLQWMHRVHDAEGARRAVDAIRAGGIEDLSLDLIFATPEGIDRAWDSELDALIALAPTHVSLYGLTIESHTPLGRWHARGAVTEASEARYEQEFLRAHERLAQAGYEHYEVSNYARPGHRAVHNSAYWTGAPYLGLGPSAHGFDGSVRRSNIEAYAAWAAALERGEDPLGSSERLTTDNRLAEAVYLGLRTVSGLAVTDRERAHVARWREAGWVTVREDADGARLVCTATGWLRLDALAADLTAFRSDS
ncbi:MAG: radical SAM family heme chaperone HemW [Gemmatimonadaceae bacterium]|nr:radical SAM family heme chaperone HemW [Gemmatimonadaceae bacterium]